MKDFRKPSYIVNQEMAEAIQKAVAGRDIAKTFFSLFPGKKTIQTFDDTPAKRKSLPRILHFDTEITEKLFTNLNFMNEIGAGIYMTINETNGKGRTAADIVKVRSVFVDLDGSPLLPTLQFNPSLIVESSPGRFHVYWFVSDLPLPAFTPMQKNLARIFSGDKVVHDLPRVLRVPGFFHKKSIPFLSVITGGLGTVFTYRGLTEMFPPEPVKQWTGKKYQLDKKPEEGDFKGQYGAVQGERVRHIMRRVGGCLKRGKGVEYTIHEVYKEAMACSPALTEKEIEPILNSVRRYGSN